MTGQHEKPFALINLRQLFTRSFVALSAVMLPSNFDICSDCLHAGGMDGRDAAFDFYFGQHIHNIVVAVPCKQHSGERVIDTEANGPKLCPRRGIKRAKRRVNDIAADNAEPNSTGNGLCAI